MDSSGESPTPTTMIYPQRIRSAKACDHCRIKRIKCSGGSSYTGNSCLACLSYNKPCVFSMPADTRYRRGKRGESNKSDNSPPASGRRDSEPEGSELSFNGSVGNARTASRSSFGTSKDLLLQTPASPAQSSTARSEAFKKVTPDMNTSYDPDSALLELQPATERDINIRAAFEATATGRRFFALYVPLMVGAPEYNVRESNALYTEHDPQTIDILAAHGLFDAMVEAYLSFVDPLCPLFENAQVVRYDVGRLMTGLRATNRTSPQMQQDRGHMRTKLVLSLGAIVIRDRLASSNQQPLQLLAVGTFHQTLFEQVSVYCYSECLKPDTLSLQIMTLVSLYSIHQQELSKALYWCRMAIRIAQFCSSGEGETPLELRLVLWCLLIIEGKVCLIQCRDDPRLRDGDLPVPDRSTQQRYPLFCMRISLARMTNRYALLLRELTSANEHVGTNLAMLSCDLVAFKDYMPLEPQVNHGSSTAEESISSSGLAYCSQTFQLEYHGAVTIILSTLSGIEQVLKSSTQKLRNHATIHVGAARKFIHHMSGMRNFLTSALCWVDPMQVLKAFVILFAFRSIRDHSLEYSDAADDKLMLASVELYGKMMLQTERNRIMLSLMKELVANLAAEQYSADMNTQSGVGDPYNSVTSQDQSLSFNVMPQDYLLGMYGLNYQ